MLTGAVLFVVVHTTFVRSLLGGDVLLHDIQWLPADDVMAVCLERRFSDCLSD